MSTPPSLGTSLNQLLTGAGQVAVSVRDLYRNHLRQTADDVVTGVHFAGMTRRGARRVYLRVAAPVVRLERRLAAIEDAAARVDARLAGNPGPPPSLDAPNFSVRTRPTIDHQLQVDVEGAIPRDSELVFVQNGVERRGRVTESGEHLLRAKVPIKDFQRGRLGVWIEHEGRRVPLTTVDIGS
jgi:hypothetical protein